MWAIRAVGRIPFQKPRAIQPARRGQSAYVPPGSIHEAREDAFLEVDLVPIRSVALPVVEGAVVAVARKKQDVLMPLYHFCGFVPVSELEEEKTIHPFSSQSEFNPDAVVRFHVAVGDEDLGPKGRFGPVLVADILNARFVEGHLVHLQIADVLAEHIGVTRLEFAAHELSGCIHMQVVERLIVDGIERGSPGKGKGFVAVDELVEGKALLLRIVSIGLGKE